MDTVPKAQVLEIDLGPVTIESKHTAWKLACSCPQPFGPLN